MFVMSNKVYELLKKVVTIIIPGFSTFYIGLAELWGLPGSLQVAGTCSLLATFLGVCLGISSSTYKKLDRLYDGDMIIEADEEGSTIRLELNSDPSVIESKDEVRFKKVNRPLKAAQSEEQA